MHQTITGYDFHDAFNKIRPDNFSYDGLNILYDYLDEFENFELDVIGICCDFSEENIKDVLENYNLNNIEELEQNTIVLYVNDDTIIYQNY